MIRDSDNAAAQAIYREVGRTESIERMIEMCRLTDSAAVPGIGATPSSRPATSYAWPVPGRRARRRSGVDRLAAGRDARGTGNRRLRRPHGAGRRRTVAIKNGWLLRDEDGLWHVSCLAIADRWVISVLARYPGGEGLETGADLCREVGAQLLGIANPVVAAAARG